MHTLDRFGNEPDGFRDGAADPESGGSGAATASWAALEEGELLTLSRAGDPEAFAELFRRHRVTAVRVAARTSRELDPEDVAAEAFARVWSALARGKGPEHAFRPYLVSAVRNVALNRCRGNRELATDPALLPEEPTEPDGLATAMAEAQLICTAFASLPERWQEALWATEVDERPMAEFAQSIGVSANAASALCLRARDGLKSAWLQAHVNRAAHNPDCEWTLARLGAHARHRLPAGQRVRVEAHLSECDSCPVTLSRLVFIGRSLKVAVIFAGVGGSLLAAKAAAGAGAAGTGTLLLAQPGRSFAELVTGWLRDAGRHLAGGLRHPGAMVARSGGRMALAAAGGAVTVVAMSVAVAAIPPAAQAARGGELSLTQVVAPATVDPGTAGSGEPEAPTDPAPSTRASSSPAVPDNGRRSGAAAAADRPVHGRVAGVSEQAPSSPTAPTPSPNASVDPSPAPASPAPTVPTPSVSPTPTVATPSVSPTPPIPTPSVTPIPPEPAPSVSSTPPVPTPSVSEPVPTPSPAGEEPSPPQPSTAPQPGTSSPSPQPSDAPSPSATWSCQPWPGHGRTWTAGPDRRAGWCERLPKH